MVPGRQVRDLLPLGRVQRSRLCQRVVPAEHVQQRLEREQPSQSRVRGSVRVAVPQLHQRRPRQGGQLGPVRPQAGLGRRRVRSGRVGSALRRRRREVRRTGRRAPRRLLDVEQHRQRVELGGPRTEAGPAAAACRRHPRQGPQAHGRDAPRVQLHRLLPVGAQPVGRKLAETLRPAGRRGRATALVRQAARGRRRLPARHHLAGLQPHPAARVPAAGLPGVLLQPRGRLGPGGRRHLQGRLQQSR
jgi:hypothetical protein